MNASDLQQFLGRYTNNMADLARQRRHVELEELLGVYEELLLAWLEIISPNYTPPNNIGRVFGSLQEFDGPLSIDLYIIIDNAIRSEDATTVLTVIEAITGFAAKCYHAKQIRLLHYYFGRCQYLYSSCDGHPELLDAVGDRLDSTLSAFLSMTLSSSLRRRDEEVGNQTTTVVFAFTLGLIESSIRMGVQKYAKHYCGRLFEDRYTRHRAYLGHRKPVELANDAILDYSAVVLVGWAIEVFDTADEKHHESARAVLDKAIVHTNQIPCEILIAEWELFNSEGGMERSIDYELGIRRWDTRDWGKEVRSGIVSTRSVRTGGWIKKGFHAALLRSQGRLLGASLEDVCPDVPKRHLWDPEAERKQLAEVAGSSHLGLTDIEPKVDQVMGLIESRARTADAVYMRYVLDSPLSPNRRDKFRTELIEGVQSRDDWYCALQPNLSAMHTPKAWPCRARGTVWVPREYLLEDNNWASGIGSHLGEQVVKHESFQLFGMLEDHAREVQPIHTLEHLADMVRMQLKQFRSDGYSPGFIILPREDRFVGALFGKPEWEIDGRMSHGESGIGSFDGVDVLRFPYSNPRSVLIIDPSRAIAETGIDIDAITIEIEETPEDKENRKRFKAARDALNDESLPIPKSSELYVHALATLLPHIGLLDEQAVISLSIEGSDGYFILDPDSKIYHRPTCERLNGNAESFKRVLRIEHDSTKGPEGQYNPCSHCNPDEWDFDTWKGDA